jgi:hypothetical protein
MGLKNIIKRRPFLGAPNGLISTGEKQMHDLELPDIQHRQVTEYAVSNNLTLEEACKKLIIQQIDVFNANQIELAKHANVFSIRASK